MKKIRLNAPVTWTSGTILKSNEKESAEIREQLLAEISQLRMQLRVKTDAGTVLEMSRRQTYSEMIDSRQRFLALLGNYQ